MKSDCESLKEKLNIDLYSLYIESNRNVSVISNLPSDVKKIYRKENLYLIDPMLNNDKEGVFMTKNNRDPQEVEFNEKIRKMIQYQ
ncbi:hypothetical protein EJA03_07160 [Vibrio pectenicida]|uniref:Uncharacterized protein n=1 Tax=Vibrio pectenicida TaxID=62763 RepID=A0A427U547_9VIBR|nr:hypothetical protein EJA03_07160 [Vibrio pectenicida]